MKLPPAIKKVIGAILVFYGVAFAIGIVVFIPTLVSEISMAIQGKQGSGWDSVVLYMFLSIIFGIVAYYMFKIGKRLFKSNPWPTSTRKRI